MAAKTPLPTSNLTFADVRDTLNIINSGAVTDSFESAFKSTANINIWSKHKPIHRPESFVQDFDSSKPNYVKDWWKGLDGNCGLIPYAISGPSHLIGYTNGKLNGWTHQLPNGGSGSPYRLGDFADYYATALGIISGFSLDSVKVDKGTNSTITASIIRQSPEMYTRSLTFADFPTLKNYYLGFFVTNGSESHFATSDTTVGSGAWQVTMKTTTWTVGSNWKAYLCLAEKKHTQDVQTSGKFYTIPYMSAQSFEVVTSSVTIGVRISRDRNATTGALNNYVSVYVSVTASPQTFSNNYLYLKLPSNTNTQPGLQDTSREQQLALPNVTVSQSGVATAVYNSNLTLNSHLQSMTEPLKYVVSIGGGAYTKAGTIAQSSPLPTTA